MSKIKRISWSNEYSPNEDVRYNHIIGTSGLGEFLIIWKGWKVYPSFDVMLNGDWLAFAVSIEESKTIAQDQLDKIITGCLENEEN